MRSEADGGQAFPCPATEQDVGCDGMTLRDYFAAKAMQADLVGAFNNPSEENLKMVAATAYRMADAMLMARMGP